MLDPKTCQCQGVNINRNIDRVKKRDTTVWLTKEQLASPKWLNSTEQAEQLVKALPDRDHEVAELAAMGVKQYKWHHSKEDHDKINDMETGTEARADLTAEQYEQVGQDMKHKDVGSSQPSGTKKRKAQTTPTGKPDNEEVKKLRTAHAARATGLKNLKTAMDKFNQEMRATEKSIGTMTSKGYPSTMADWYVSQLQQNRGKYMVHHAAYVEHMSEVPSTPWDEERLMSSSKCLETMLVQLKAEFKTFMDSVSHDVKNLVQEKGAASSKDKK